MVVEVVELIELALKVVLKVVVEVELTVLKEVVEAVPAVMKREAEGVEQRGSKKVEEAELKVLKEVVVVAVLFPTAFEMWAEELAAFCLWEVVVSASLQTIRA